jgi:hypothetical protein
MSDYEKGRRRLLMTQVACGHYARMATGRAMIYDVSDPIGGYANSMPAWARDQIEEWAGKGYLIETYRRSFAIAGRGNDVPLVILRLSATGDAVYEQMWEELKQSRKSQ